MIRTFGTATLKKGVWSLSVEPHVRLRLKRMFPAMKGSEVLEMRATESNSRDLQWVLSRYPLDVARDDQIQLFHAATKFDDRARYFLQVLQGHVLPRQFALALPPRDYQQQAADLVLRSNGLLIADELGVGKTVSAICVLSAPETLPALVVTLTALPWQWQQELTRFAPNLHTHVLKQARPYDFVGKNEEVPDVLITSYSKLAGWAPELVGGIRTVIFDEVQELRRPGTDKYEAAEAIAAEASYRVGLSATPIYNMGSEFFHIFSVLCPDALGTWDEFAETWCTGKDAKAKIAEPAAFGAYLREAGLMIRRTRVDVKRELPPFQQIAHYVECDDGALNIISRDIAELARFVLDQSQKPFARMQASNDLDWRLRQATGISKAKYVAAFVRLLVESGESVVLFGWHHAVYRIWMAELAEFHPVMFTGQETPLQKKNAKEAFVSGVSKVMIMSLRSGAGLDGLQYATRTVVHGELDWSKGVMDQCDGRVYRDGQPDPVTSYYLLCTEGSDPVIADVLGVKAGQLRGVVDPNAVLVEAQADPDRIKRLAESILSKRSLARAS